MEHPHILDQWLRWAIREGHRLLHQQVAGSVSGIQYVWKYVGIPQVYTQVKQTVPINAGYIPHILKPFCWGFLSCHPALGCLRQGSFQWNEPCCTAPAGIPGWCGEVTPSHMGTVYGTIGLITTLLILLVFAWQKKQLACGVQCLQVYFPSLTWECSWYSSTFIPLDEANTNQAAKHLELISMVSTQASKRDCS